MKKNIILLLFLLISILTIGSNKTAIVEVTADILRPITITKISDVDFGSISIGSSNVPVEQEGKIAITGYGNIKVEWKALEGSEFKSIKENLEVPIYNSDRKAITTKLMVKDLNSLNGNNIKITKLNGEEFSITGVIENVPVETEPGKYSGGIVIRATYVD